MHEDKGCDEWIGWIKQYMRVMKRHQVDVMKLTRIAGDYCVNCRRSGENKDPSKIILCSWRERVKVGLGAHVKQGRIVEGVKGQGATIKS